jgi:hypothetical protein
LWVERESAALTLRTPAPDARRSKVNPMRAIAAVSVDAVERRHDISCIIDPVTAREQDMNAPPNIDLVTAHSDSDVVH